METAYRLELTPAQMKVTHAALRSMLQDFGHDERDVHDLVKAVLAKFPSEEEIRGIDLRAEIAASPSQETLSRLGRIDENTLVIGLSAGRPHPLVVRAMKIARHRKAHTLAITDATLSEISKLSERTLYYSSSSPAFVRSHVGLLSILQALAFGVYARDAAQYDDRIRAFKLK